MEAVRARGTMPVAMKVPPHLERQGSMMAYPLALPTGPLEELAPAGSPDHAAMVRWALTEDASNDERTVLLFGHGAGEESVDARSIDERGRWRIPMGRRHRAMLTQSG